MKNVLLLGATLIMAWGIFSCSAQSDKTPVAQAPTSTKPMAQKPTSAKVEVYYFHFTARCVTCVAVEEQTKTNIESFYRGKVTFKSVNLDDASSKALAQKLKIAGQTLLLVKGSTQINLTAEGFMYARTDPEKFKSILKGTIDGLLK